MARSLRAEKARQFNRSLASGSSLWGLNRAGRLILVDDGSTQPPIMARDVIRFMEAREEHRLARIQGEIDAITG